MRTGRPKLPLSWTPEERRELESLAHRSRSLPALARRAPIVLACAAGADNKIVARRLRVTPATVDPRHGPGHRFEPHGHQPYLACLRPATASQPSFRIVARSTAGAESAPYRRAVRKPARPSGGVLRGREVADSGFGSHRAAPARAARTSHTNTAAWHDLAVAALDAKSGNVIGHTHRRHRSLESKNAPSKQAFPKKLLQRR